MGLKRTMGSDPVDAGFASTQLTADALRLDEIFDGYDTNGDKTLQLEELNKMLGGLAIVTTEYRRLMDEQLAASEDKDKMDKPAFRKWLRQCKTHLESRPAVYEELLEQLEQKQLFTDEQEAKGRAMYKDFMQLQEEDVEMAVSLDNDVMDSLPPELKKKLVDGGEQGQLSAEDWNEYMLVTKRTNGNTAFIKSLKSVEQTAQLTKQQRAEVEVLFAVIDTNNDDHISLKEAKVLDGADTHFKDLSAWGKKPKLPAAVQGVNLEKTLKYFTEVKQARGSANFELILDYCQSRVDAELLAKARADKPELKASKDSTAPGAKPRDSKGCGCVVS